MQLWISHPHPGLAPLEAAAVSPADRGYLLGDGLFETVRLCGGRAPLLDWHLARLAEGCGLLGMPLPRLDWAAILAEVAGANGAAHGDGYARITVSRGTGPRGYAPPQNPEPRVSVQAGPWSPPEPARALQLAAAPWPQPVHPVLSRVKHTSRLLQVLARAEADRLGVGELLFCDPAGRLAEAIASNLFWVRGGQLFTPDLATGCLPGVARRWVCSQAQATGRLDPPEALRKADEIFLTNALTGPVPVSAVAGVGEWAAPGPVTSALQAQWRALFGYR